VRARKPKRPQDFVRPQAIAHEPLLAGKTISNRAARLRHGQDVAINRETGSFRCAPGSPVRLAPALAKLPDSLKKPIWSDTPPLGCSPVCRGFPFALSPHSPSFSPTAESQKGRARTPLRAVFK
jgi:hypothetical protein